MLMTDTIREEYSRYRNKKIITGIVLLLLLAAAVLFALCTGPMGIGPVKAVKALFGAGTETDNIVVWNIRLPRILAAVIAGMSLAAAGCVMQCLLKNPLASPFTMGISQGAAFGAAFAIIILGLGVKCLRVLESPFEEYPVLVYGVDISLSFFIG